MKYVIEPAQWRTLYDKYWLEREFGILLLFKPTMFTLGVEFWKGGCMFFLGPLAFGLGTVDVLDTE